MKKIKYLLFALLLFAVIGVVNASTQIFVKNWNAPLESYDYHRQQVGYEEGFLLAETADESSYKLRIYNENGEKTKEVTINNSTQLLSILVDDGNIFILNENKIENGTSVRFDYSVLKYNSDLELVAASERIEGLNPAYEAQGLAIVDDSVWVLDRDYGGNHTAFVFNEDLSSYEEVYPINTREVFPEYYYYESFNNELNDRYSRVYLSVYNDHVLKAITTTSGTNCGHITRTPLPVNPYMSGALNPSQTCYDSVVILYDDNDEELWTKDLSGYAVDDVELLDNYVLVSVGTSALVYDYEGNDVQELKDGDFGFFNLTRGKNDVFMVTEYCTGEFITELSKSPTPCEPKYQVYVLGYPITTKIEGKGEIQVVPSALPGEPVTFTIEPEEGYVLSSVKVTDAAGNVLVLTQNTFTMPSADVEIEVLFVKAAKNPETKDIAIAMAIAILALAGAAVANLSRRLNWLK